MERKADTRYLAVCCLAAMVRCIPCWLPSLPLPMLEPPVNYWVYRNMVLGGKTGQVYPSALVNAWYSRSP